MLSKEALGNFDSASDLVPSRNKQYDQYKLTNITCASFWDDISGLILGLHPANERRRYNVTPSLIGWAQT